MMKVWIALSLIIFSNQSWAHTPKDSDGGGQATGAHPAGAPIPEKCADFSGKWVGDCTGSMEDFPPGEKKPAAVLDVPPFRKFLSLEQNKCASLHIRATRVTATFDDDKARHEKKKGNRIPFNEDAKDYDFSEEVDKDFEVSEPSVRADWAGKDNPQVFRIEAKSVRTAKPKEKLVSKTNEGLTSKVSEKHEFEFKNGKIFYKEETTSEDQQNGKPLGSLSTKHSCVFQPLKTGI
jgi:hypothetical protein